MKLKYYLRGLGTGIAVTALIIGISTIASRKEVMTDEEVIARAKELGMVERTVLSETVTESEESEEESEPEPEAESSEESESEEDEVTKSEPLEDDALVNELEESVPEESAPEESAPAESTPEESEIEIAEHEEEQPAEQVADVEFGMPDEAGTISIQIVRGDSSVSVSKRLEEAGLIDSAVDYDRYLCQNGYDKKIQTGNYDIPANATQEEIAIMITSR